LSNVPNGSPLSALSSGWAATTIPRPVKHLPSILCLAAVIALEPSCRVPRAIIVQLPLKKNSQETSQETTATQPLPGQTTGRQTKGRNDDMPRTPDMLNQLPDERDFQPTNPSASKNAPSDGAVVAKPPSSTPPRKEREKTTPHP